MSLRGPGGYSCIHILVSLNMYFNFPLQYIECAGLDMISAFPIRNKRVSIRKKDINKYVVLTIHQDKRLPTDNIYARLVSLEIHKLLRSCSAYQQSTCSSYNSV